MPWNCCSCLPAALAMLEQGAWFVDSAIGDDANDGATALTALRTLAGLTRRWNGRVFSPAVTAVTVTLTGSFPTETLDLQAAFTAPNLDVPVLVQGQMAPAGLAGTITAYQPFVVSTTRASVTDAAANFTASKRKRIRITSNIGGALGAVSTVASLGGGVTIANIGQFTTVTGLTGTTVNPAVNDTYIVEDFVTKIKQWNVDCPGAAVTLRDISWLAPAGGVANSHSLQATNFLLKVFGCELDTGTSIVQNVDGHCTITGSHVTGSSVLQTTHCFQSWKNSVVTSTNPLTHALGSSIQGTSMMHDGDGVRNAGLAINNNSQVSDTTQRCFFGSVNAGGSTCLARAGGGGAQWRIAAFWGAAGNTVTNACQIVNGSAGQFTAGTPPTATGNTPGVNDVTIGGVGMAWAALPFANAAPNNAAFNIAQ